MVELKKIVDEAVKHCPTIQHVLVAHRTDNKVHMGRLDIPLEQVGLSHIVQFKERLTPIGLTGSESCRIVVLNLGPPAMFRVP